MTTHEQSTDNMEKASLDSPDLAPAVKVENVSMIFNMASEQLNSLKEYAIALGKRELRFKEFHALKDVSFEVARGDVFGILGTNGSGKSTLLKIIAGVLEPTSGSLEINGRIAPLIELGAGFDMDLTARENIYLNGALLGYSKRLIDENFNEIVDFAEIENFLDIPIKNYSSGMIARIAFSIATVIVPDILLVDEVLSVGDFMFQQKCENRIRQLIDEHGVTVLIVSHSNDQIRRLCNKAIWIDKGDTRLLGNSDLVCSAYAALGGRTGSQESKKLLFDRIVSRNGRAEYPDHFHSVEGNAFKISVSLAEEAHARTGITPDTVILASSASHINSVYANTIAKPLDAVVLPINTDNISVEVLQYLYKVKPSKILYIDCGGSGTRALRILETLPFDTDIVDLSDDTGDTVGYSSHIFEYGIDNNLWPSKQMVLLDYKDEMAALSLTPFLYENSCPIIVVNAAVNEADAVETANMFKMRGFEELIAVGDVLNTDSVKGVDKIFDARILDTEGSTSEICNRLYDMHNARIAPKAESLCITFASFSQWMNYVGVGRYICETNSFLVSLDSTDLDSIVHCLDFAYAHQESITSGMVIEGSEDLDALYRSLFNEALTQPDNA